METKGGENERENRSVTLKVRVKPTGASVFEEIAKQRGMTTSDALRQSIADWTNKWIGVGR